VTVCNRYIRHTAAVSFIFTGWQLALALKLNLTVTLYTKY